MAHYRCGLTTLTGVNMNMYQTNRAIKTLRLVAHSGPLPMELHDQITKSLVDLLRHRIVLKETKKVKKILINRSEYANS